MGHYYNTPHPQPLRGVPPLVVLACPHTQHTETSILFLLEKNHLPLCSHTPLHTLTHKPSKLALLTSLPTHHTIHLLTHNNNKIPFTIHNQYLYVMYRIDLFSILASDSKELIKMQTRLNQWLTAGTLKKYDVHTTSEYIVFNVCRSKEKGE